MQGVSGSIGTSKFEMIRPSSRLARDLRNAMNMTKIREIYESGSTDTSFSNRSSKGWGKFGRNLLAQNFGICHATELAGQRWALRNPASGNLLAPSSAASRSYADHRRALKVGGSICVRSGSVGSMRPPLQLTC